jgi:rhodanese-related sulfurtransferase
MNHIISRFPALFGPVVVIALATTLFATIPAIAQQHSTLGPQEVAKLIDGGNVALILDVRSMEEYRSSTGHLKGAQLVPHTEISSKLAALKPFKDKTILVYCHSGRRSNMAATFLAENGFTKVIDMSGGITGWLSAGLPTQK